MRGGRSLAARARAARHRARAQSRSRSGLRGPARQPSGSPRRDLSPSPPRVCWGQEGAVVCPPRVRVRGEGLFGAGCCGAARSRLSRVGRCVPSCEWVGRLGDCAVAVWAGGRPCWVGGRGSAVRPAVRAPPPPPEPQPAARAQGHDAAKAAMAVQNKMSLSTAPIRTYLDSTVVPVLLQVILQYKYNIPLQ